MSFRHTQYVRLHVTLLITTKTRPLLAFFDLTGNTTIPDTILTSGITSRSQLGIPPPMFQSITWHGETFPGSGEYVVKILSLTYLKDTIIKAIIGEEPGWVLRKEWDSYPVLEPISRYPPVEPIKGLQYLAAMEPWISS